MKRPEITPEQSKKLEDLATLCFFVSGVCLILCALVIALAGWAA